MARFFSANINGDQTTRDWIVKDAVEYPTMYEAAEQAQVLNQNLVIYEGKDGRDGDFTDGEFLVALSYGVPSDDFKAVFARNLDHNSAE